MPSSFTWLDYSETERRKMLDVINLFRDKDTRDEMGVGSIRDAFADMFFPGTSTIQTRARYFLFIAWLYQQIESEHDAASQLPDLLRRRETQLIYGLLAGGESEGVIGRDARERLQRLPSNVYWLGLYTWGIRLFPDSQDQYHRSLVRYRDAVAARQAYRRESDEQLDDLVAPNWHLQLPRPPADFPRKVTFRLTPSEADYLAERIRISVPKSLLAFLVDCPFHPTSVAFAWNHPHLAEFRQVHREQLIHARAFSEVIHGSALLYNLMLAELTRNEQRVSEYTLWLERWASDLNERAEELANWNRDHFWQTVLASGAHITAASQQFVNRWYDLACPPARPEGIAGSEAARLLILLRERQLKRNQARLENTRARDLWTGAAGVNQLSFRWNTAQQMVNDIHHGLQGANAC